MNITVAEMRNNWLHASLQLKRLKAMKCTKNQYMENRKEKNDTEQVEIGSEEHMIALENGEDETTAASEREGSGNICIQDRRYICFLCNKWRKGTARCLAYIAGCN